MIVQFSKPIVVPDNFTDMNETIFKINIIPGEDSDQTKLDYKWTVTDFSST